MGCYAAISVFKIARHIIRSEPQAKVIVVNLELCTIHLQEIDDLAQVLCFSLWGDGCSACLISAEPSGVALRSFNSKLITYAADQISVLFGKLGI
jgi:alpha-pyrone synthase